MADKILKSFDIWIAAQGVKSRTRSRTVDNISLEGIARLRELILELAIQGKLVSQDINEEPASVLLNRIEAERNSLLKQGKIKSKVELESNSESLPRGWAWAQLPLICDINVGRTPSTKDSQYWSDSSTGIPWVSISDMNHSGTINKTEKYISKIAAGKVFKGLPATAGTLLMSFKLTVGKISILDIDAYHNEAIISIRPFADMNRDYLFKVLPKIALGGNTKKAIMGNTLNQSSLASLQIPIPPLAEQNRIVAKVEELMALCDELEKQETHHLKSHALLAETLLRTLTQAKDAKEFQQAWTLLAKHFDDLFTTEDSIDQLKQTILQLAVMGKLAPQDPNDEPAGELLKRIETARLSRNKKSPKNISQVNENERFFDLPANWRWCRLGELIRFMAYGTSQKTNDNPVHVPVLRMGNITSEGKLVYNNLKYISPNHKDLPALYLEDGDIVFNRTNSYDLVGKSGVYTEGPRKYTLASYLIKVSPFVDLTNSDFLNLYINSPVCRRTQIEPQITAQTNQANFSGSKLTQVVIPLPPLDEQHRIVSKVNELFALCDNLKARLAAAQTLAKQMAEAVVKQV